MYMQQVFEDGFEKVICPCDALVYVCVQKELSKLVMEYEQQMKVLYAHAHAHERHVYFIDIG